MITRVALGAAASVASATALAGAPGFFCDPVVTHTNGMRLASSTPLRSHNVYWQCDPGHVGYCGGLMRTPCLEDLRSVGTRYHGRYVPPPTPMGATPRRTGHAMDGLELDSSASLGSLTIADPQDVGPRGGPAGPR